jgi:hypothetical protein
MYDAVGNTIVKAKKMQTTEIGGIEASSSAASEQQRAWDNYIQKELDQAELHAADPNTKWYTHDEFWHIVENGK